MQSTFCVYNFPVVRTILIVVACVDRSMTQEGKYATVIYVVNVTGQLMPLIANVQRGLL